MEKLKRDRASTEWRQSPEAGPLKFLDRRSYCGTDGHVYLWGKDRSCARAELFARVHGKCHVCGSFAPETGYPGFHGEVHHRGCYCLSCLEWRCGQLVRPCHRHRTSQFKKVAPGLAAARREAKAKQDSASVRAESKSLASQQREVDDTEL